MNAVKELGKRLAARLDEDDWGYIEPFLNECATDIESLRHRLADQALTIKTMREALEKFIDSHEECTDFDGFTAQIVSMDDYHEAQEALAIPDNSTEILQEWLDKQLGDKNG